jgi:alkanesulfonate monooxygenase SsuD/methylene tetrahydromethanopterin reductase-like flavin-dependent oxidoreductase (luciferase family)
MAVSLGVHVGQQAASMAELRSLWRRLDGAGVDWISVWDHLYEAPPLGGTVDHFEALSTLGALAADTENARLGCLVFCVLYRNPGMLAKAATTLDHISGGRFELGLGAGWHDQEAQAYGYDFPPVGRRLDQLEEAIPLIRSLLTQDRTTHEGEHFRTVDASCRPAPVQDRLPIWIGGTGEKRTLRIAAQHADGWNAAYVGVDRYRHLNEAADRWCASFDRDPATLRRSVNLIFALTSDDRDVMQVLDGQGWGPAAPFLADGALGGSLDDVVERVLAYVDAGADELNIALRHPWDEAKLDAYLELLPTIRAATAAR